MLSFFPGCTSVSCTVFFLMSAFITRNTRKTHENTKKKKSSWMGLHVVPSPVPHTKLSKINEMHEKGDRGWKDSATESEIREG